MKYKVKNISESVLAANSGKMLVGKSTYDLPTDAFETSRKALLSAGLIKELEKKSWETKSFGDSKQYRWAPAYAGIKQDALNAAFVLGAFESVGELKTGTTQNAIDDLVAALPPLPVDTAGNIVVLPTSSTNTPTGGMTMWLVGGGLAAVAAFVLMRKHKRKRGGR